MAEISRLERRQFAMFNARLKSLKRALHFSAPAGMAFTSGGEMQLAAVKNVGINAAGDVSAGVMGNLTALTGKKTGLFARTGRLSLKSGEGAVEVQAQNGSLRQSAEKALTLTSTADVLLAFEPPYVNTLELHDDELRSKVKGGVIINTARVEHQKTTGSEQ